MTTPDVVREAERIAESKGFDPQQVRNTQVNRVVTLTLPGVVVSGDFMNAAYQSGYLVLSASTADLEQAEIKTLESRVAALEQEVEILRMRLDENELEVVVLRTISKEQAKQEALELFRNGEPLLYSDVARKLRIDLAQAVEICEELIAEGETTIHDDSD